MADIFLSYAKRHAGLTEELARDLETEGFTTWWDTSLLPGDEFPEEIAHQIDAAKVVIVIWTDASVESPWVRAEASRAHAQGKLITLHAPGLDLERVPLPFNTLQSATATDRAKVFAALARRGVRGSRGAGLAPAARASEADGTRVALADVEEFVAQVWGRGAKRPSKRLMIALKLLNEKGWPPDEIAPFPWRFLWACGVYIPPPAFMSFGTLALLMGTFILAGMWCIWFAMMLLLFLLASPSPSPAEVFATMFDPWKPLLGLSVVVGLLYAGFTAYTRRHRGLPSWSDLPSR